MTLRWICGDNLPALKRLPESTFTLAYLDPPFMTGKQHFFTGKERNKFAFDDSWENSAAYREALELRLRAIYPLLAPHSSIVIHVDPRTSHYVRILCDDIFGPRAFASDIVWRYRRWPSKTPNFQRVHDVLIRYVKDPDVTPRFNQLYEPLAASTLAAFGTRKQRAVTDSDGRRLRSSSTEEESPGVPLGDVWDIGILAPIAKERTGYPTQKPEALLERLVTALTDPGDWILDPYAGSGTTLVVAGKLGRNAVAIDLNPDAQGIALQRCIAQGLNLDVDWIP